MNRILLVWALIVCLSTSAQAQSPRVTQPPLLAKPAGGAIRIRSGSFSKPTSASSFGAGPQAVETPEIHILTAPLPFKVVAMKMLALGVGWAQAGHRLFFTDSGGINWRDITPPASNPSRGEALDDVFFLDTRRGWALLLAGLRRVAGKPDGEAQFDLASTNDAGATWETYHVVVPPQVMEDPDRIFPNLTGRGKLTFADPLHGWMNLAGEGSADQGRLLVTSDGGRTWNQAQGDREEWASMVLVTPEVGWMVGGGGSNELYVTRDGAKSFEQVSLAVPTELPQPEPPHEYEAVYSLPTFEDSKHGFLAVTYSGGEKVKSATVLFATDDGGRKWKVDRILRNLEDAGGLGVMPSAVVNSSWITIAIADHHPTLTKIDSSARVNAFIDPASGSSGYFRAGSLSFVTPNQGWVTVGDGALLSTFDSGTTWTDISPSPQPRVIQPGNRSSLRSEPIGDLAASRLANNPAAAVPAALSQQVSKHLGFHAYSTVSPLQMSQWWTFSPYFDVGIYLNGAHGHTGHDNNLDNSTWLNAVNGQG